MMYLDKLTERHFSLKRVCASDFNHHEVAMLNLLLPLPMQRDFQQRVQFAWADLINSLSDFK
jgi:hypothetical protein